MGVKIFDRQLLHMGEQFISHIPQCSLGHRHHDPVVRIGRNDSHSVKYGHPSDRMRQRRKIRRIRQKERRNIIVDQIFRKHGPLDIGDHTQKYED